MSKKIVLYFPTNYRHGDPEENFYTEEISILSISPRTSDFINEIFKKTQLYKNLDFLSYKPYIQWHSIIDTSESGIDIFVAVPKITVFYQGSRLKYFHVPSYDDAKFDFYLLTGSKNNIMSSKDLIITDNILSGKYIISL